MKAQDHHAWVALAFFIADAPREQLERIITTTEKYERPEWEQWLAAKAQDELARRDLKARARAAIDRAIEGNLERAERMTVGAVC